MDTFVKRGNVLHHVHRIMFYNGNTRINDIQCSIVANKM